MPASPSFPKIPNDWTDTKSTQQGISYRIWKNPNSRTQKALFLIHGYGEHSGRYEHFPFYMNNNVDVIFAFDLPGHGLSEGSRGHAEHFSDLTEASLHMLKLAQTKYPDLSWYLVSHSMGSLIALQALMQNPNLSLKKVSVSAPYLDLAQPVSAIKQAFGLAIEPLFPRLPIKNVLSADVLSHDPHVVKAQTEDPLVHPFITPRLYKTLLQTQHFVKNWPGVFNYSIQFLIPMADPLVSWKESLHLAKTLKVAAGKTKEIQGFPNFFHEGFNEIEKGRYFNALTHWIQS